MAKAEQLAPPQFLSTHPTVSSGLRTFLDDGPLNMLRVKIE